VTMLGWMAAGRVWVEEDNRITQRMTRFPCGDSVGGEELEPNLLGLGSLVAIDGYACLG
jgi:hypothetical protein